METVGVRPTTGRGACEGPHRPAGFRCRLAYTEGNEESQLANVQCVAPPVATHRQHHARMLRRIEKVRRPKSSNAEHDCRIEDGYAAVCVPFSEGAHEGFARSLCHGIVVS